MKLKAEYHKIDTANVLSNIDKNQREFIRRKNQWEDEEENRHRPDEVPDELLNQQFVSATFFNEEIDDTDEFVRDRRQGKGEDVQKQDMKNQDQADKTRATIININAQI